MNEFSVADVLGYVLTIIFGIVGLTAGYKWIKNNKKTNNQNNNSDVKGDIIGGDKIGGDKVAGNKITVEVNGKNELEKKRINGELFQLILDNLNYRLELYKEAQKRILELMYSGDAWWADDAQEVLNVINDKGLELDKEIDNKLKKLDKISPILKANCEEYIKYEVEKRSVLSAYLVLPDDRAKRDNGYTFEEKFEKVIKDLDKGIETIKRQMNDLLKN